MMSTVLFPPDAPTSTARERRVHLVGIGGDGMSALAQLYLDAGWQVSGSDRIANPKTATLAALGADIHIGHAPERIAAASLVVSSAAVPRNDPELAAARAAGVPLQTRSLALTRLLARRELVCVAGSHGKTTTSAILSALVDATERTPGFMLGGPSDALGGVTGRLGEGCECIVETCEAFRALDYWQPHHLLVTNVDDEHSDHYGGRNHLETAFADLIDRVPTGGHLVLCGDDSLLARIAADTRGRALTYGLGAACSISAVAVVASPQGTSFDLLVRQRVVGRFSLPVPGRHNLQNALGALAMALALDVDAGIAATALSRFRTVDRRWNPVGAVNGIRLFDDFAHHPTEIHATLELARQVAQGGRVVAVLRPQLISRVTRLAEDYALALAGADLAFVLPIDAGGEVGDENLATAVLHRALAARHPAFAAVPEAAAGAARIAPALRPGDLVVGLGPSSVRRVAEALLARLSGAGAVSEPAPVDPFRAESVDSSHGAVAGVRGAALVRSPTRPVAAEAGDLLHSAFERQAASRPEAICAYEGDRAWTCGRLNAQANRVAAALQARGIGPEDLVVLHMDKSLHLLALMLGVLKAGAAFVPIDPAMARAGLQVSLARAGAALTISDRSHDDCSRAGLEGAVRLADFLSTLPAVVAAVPCQASPATLAYAMFTSGSSGTPRLVGVEHRSVAHVVGCSVREVYDREDFRLVPLLASISFDASIQQMFAPLSAAGRLLVVADISELLRSSRYSGITMMGMTPSLMRVLLDTAPLPDALRTIVLGGEPIPDDLLTRLRALPGVRRVRNVYGPTETTIYSMTAVLHDGGAPGGRTAAAHRDGFVIGTPITGMHVRLVGADGADVCAGETGELLLAGPGVSRGYLGEPERTAECFFDDPCRRGRAYRTGDLARQLPDGRYQYQGRIDDQMKINGVRIEPSEVEALLESCPGVDRAAAVKVDEAPGMARLVAFVVTKAAVDVAGLRQWLRARAPAVMIPAGVVLVDDLPRLVSGKVDRQALARSWRKRRRVARTAASDDGPAARMLDCWRTALRNPWLRQSDDFFELGGDSLTLMQLVVAVEREFCLRLGAQEIQEVTTAAAMVETLSERLGEPMPASPADTERIETILARQRTYLAAWRGFRTSPHALIVMHNHEGKRPPLFWCFQGYNELSALAAELGPDQPIGGMRSGHLVMKYSADSITGLARAYADELAVLHPEGSFRIGGNCQGATVARAVALALRERGRRVVRLVLMEVSRFWFYDEPVELVFGRDSDVNPLRHGPLRARELEEAYPDGYRFHLVDGAHGRFFTPRNIATLAETVAGILATPQEAQRPQPLERMEPHRYPLSRQS